MKTMMVSIWLLAAASCSALAQNTPVGVWKTFDDDGKTVKSLVRVSDSGGQLTGAIERMLDPAQQEARCDKCSGARKDQALKGLALFDNAEPEGPDTWAGGEILDPKTGKLFKMRLKLLDGSAKMEVRAYAGPLSRAQTWIRVE
jgi:uncharacterized protein (DUF2147 family)